MYLLGIPRSIPAIALASLLILFVDIYPSVKSFMVMLRTASFLLLWLISFMLTMVAYLFLMTTSLAKIQGLVGPEGTKLTAILLAALMQATILQSLSLKISEVKIINLQALIDSYRTQVLEDITKKNSQRERLHAFHLADQLCQKFKDDVNGITEEYSQLLLATGQTQDSATQLVGTIEQNAKSLNISKVKLIAGSIARLDQARAKQLLS
jgi:hypothetical protein